DDGPTFGGRSLQRHAPANGNQPALVHGEGNRLRRDHVVGCRAAAGCRTVGTHHRRLGHRDAEPRNRDVPGALSSQCTGRIGRSNRRHGDRWPRLPDRLRRRRSHPAGELHGDCRTLVAAVFTTAHYDGTKATKAFDQQELRVSSYASWLRDTTTRNEPLPTKWKSD